MSGHPIRDAEIRIFRSVDDGECIGKLRPYDSWPITFRGTDESAVRAKMEAFIADTIEANEAKFIARQEALAKARASRAKKAVQP